MTNNAESAVGTIVGFVVFAIFFAARWIFGGNSRAAHEAQTDAGDALAALKGIPPHANADETEATEPELPEPEDPRFRPNRDPQWPNDELDALWALKPRQTDKAPEPTGPGEGPPKA